VWLTLRREPVFIRWSDEVQEKGDEDLLDAFADAKDPGD